MIPLLVIGIGNEYRRDDAVGLIVARALQAQALPGVAVIEAERAGVDLLECWAGADAVILIDAVCSRAQPGILHIIDAHGAPVPADLFTCSTHGFGVATTIELARSLHRLPPRLMLFGIEGKEFGIGWGLSIEMESILPAITERIAQMSRAMLRSLATEGEVERW
ncbi:MAG: hydrogenase maturation protease [Caldilineaceae bacterium]|nr:hydrogenase maturation protease [Caldilineaceae bacterium]